MKQKIMLMLVLLWGTGLSAQGLEDLQKQQEYCDRLNDEWSWWFSRPHCQVAEQYYPECASLCHDWDFKSIRSVACAFEMLCRGEKDPSSIFDYDYGDERNYLDYCEKKEGVEQAYIAYQQCLERRRKNDQSETLPSDSPTSPEQQ